MTKEIKRFAFRCVDCQQFTISKVYKTRLSRSVLSNDTHGQCTTCKRRVRVIYDYFVQPMTPLDTK
jgi:hypothetical protein